MTEILNEHLKEILTRLFHGYIEDRKPGYKSGGVFYHAGIDERGEDSEDHNIRIHLMEDGSDVGLYQFYIEDDFLVVADYFEREDVYGKYTNHEFDEIYDVILNWSDWMYLLKLLKLENAYAYVAIDSRYITHKDLMCRLGWDDKRIKDNFPNTPMDSYDKVKYYPLVKVFEIEKTL